MPWPPGSASTWRGRCRPAERRCQGILAPPSAFGTRMTNRPAGPARREPIARPFYDRPPLDVARDLLGKIIAHDGVEIRITEVEAYAGTEDPASHARRGPTPRCAVMFGPPGHLYVYFTYGMHWCANIVCHHDGIAAAALLRAGQVVGGVDRVRDRRPTAGSDRDLARGPARLTTALGIIGAHNGVDLTNGGGIQLLAGAAIPDEPVRYGPRVGVVAAADRPWRIWIDGDRTVSAYRAGRPARPTKPDKAPPSGSRPERSTGPRPGPNPRFDSGRGTP